jgi:hypothetical protein
VYLSRLLRPSLRRLRPGLIPNHHNLDQFKRNRQHRLMPRIAKIIAGVMIVATTACAGIAVAESYVAHTDLELRVGADYVCGICGPERIKRIRTMVQVFADRLFPVTRIGDGVLEIGPYAKGALLDGGHVPQIAGGAVLGYRFGAYEVLVNVGRAYATEVIGVTSSPNSGQSRQTYDIGLSLRYDINRYFISVGYQHNSNGKNLGINFSGGEGSNPGIDSAFVGGGVRF